MGNRVVTTERVEEKKTELEIIFQSPGELKSLKTAFSFLQSQARNSVSKSSFAEFFNIKSDEFPSCVSSSLLKNEIHSKFGFKIFKLFFAETDEITWDNFLQIFATCKLSTGEEKLKFLIFLIQDSNPHPIFENEKNEKNQVQRMKNDEIKTRLMNTFEKMDEEFMNLNDVYHFFLSSWVMSYYNSIDFDNDDDENGKDGDRVSEKKMITNDLNPKEKEKENESHLKNAENQFASENEQKKLNDLTNIDSILESVIEFSKSKSIPASTPNLASESSLNIRINPKLEETFEKILCKDFCFFVLKTFPSISEILPNFLSKKVLDCRKTKKVNYDYSSHEILPRGIITRGIAWNIALTQTGKTKQTFFEFCFNKNIFKSCNYDLLYKSTINGKGLKNLFANVEGYGGQIVIIISFKLKKNNDEFEYSTSNTSSPSGNVSKCHAGAILPDGISNRDTFYGNSSTCLFSFYPKFSIFRSTSKEKNYVYSYFHLPGTVYQSLSKTQGIGFGGNFEKKRIFIDKDFEKVNVFHHVYDKTFSSGNFVPNQGYREIEGLVEDFEAWGFGGKEAMDKLHFFQQRESIFTEQRGKIDLKKFVGNWEDSPDKAILNLVSNPVEPSKQER